MSGSTNCDEPRENQVLSGYRLRKKVGSGAYGDVWLAEEILTGVRRAIKFLPKTGSRLSPGSARELNGIRQYQLKTSGHSSLVQIHFADETPDYFFYVMELADNAEADESSQRMNDGSEFQHRYHPLTLAVLLKRDAPLSATKALAIIEQVVQGLLHLHNSGLIHRDVKPSNVLVVGGRFKLADVGLVTDVEGDVTCLGTPGYVRPHEKLDQSADLYATGMILYEMITGLDRLRFPKLPVLRADSRKERRELRAAIRVFNKAAHPDRRRCYESAAQFLHDITAGRSRGRQTSLQLLAVAAVIILIIVMMWVRQPWTGRVVSAVTDPSTRDVLKIVFEDGRETQIRFRSPVGQAQIVDFAGDGNQVVAVGTRSAGGQPGRLMVLDPKGKSPLLDNAVFDLDPFQQPPWDHQAFVPPCDVSAVAAANLDGVPGQELILSIRHTECPTRWVVYTKEMSVLSEYWHYGHMSFVETADLDGDGLPELVCWGIANKREDGLPFGALNEKGHCAILVLNPRRRGPGCWSMNSWMNKAAQAPVAYGYVKEPMEERPDALWNIKSVTVHPNAPLPIRLDLTGGLLLELDGELVVGNIRRDGMDSPWTGPIPDADDVWVRMWPPDRESVQDNPSGNE